MAPAPSADAGDEILIAARIDARLLGLRLLTLGARVTVGPADGAGALPATGWPRRVRRRRFRSGRRFRCRRAVRDRIVPVGRRRRRATLRGPALDGRARENRRPPVGDGLAQSEQLIGQATAVLAEVSDR